MAKLLDQHLTFEEIAVRLDISRRTVKYHCDTMRVKLGVSKARRIPYVLKKLGVI